MSEQKSLSLSSESIKEESVIRPYQEDESQEEQSLSSSLSSSPTIESQVLLLLSQAVTMSSTEENSTWSRSNLPKCLSVVLRLA
jgi:hypothetical protein